MVDEIKLYEYGAIIELNRQGETGLLVDTPIPGLLCPP
jgi:hypothetical protein